MSNPTNASSQPQRLDPEHDINARSATLWVLGGTIVLFASLYLMLPIFIRVSEEERRKKIYEAPTTELNQLLAEQQAFLDGDNPKKKTLAEAMAEALKK